MNDIFKSGESSHFGESAPLADMDEFPSWIIFEDENFLVLNKPGWLVCHPSKNGPLSSLVGAAREYLKADTLHLVSRLDRETSGVVVLAKNRETASIAQKALDGKTLVGKKYIAVLRGKMVGTFTIAQPLSDDKNSLVAIKTCCCAQKLSAKKAASIFTPIAYSDDDGTEPCTLAKVEIITGRKHQIRAHALWAGHQIVGDKLYGPDETFYLDFAENGFSGKMAEVLPTKRQMLHAYESDFTKVFPYLPVFKAPILDDMRNYLLSRKIAIPEFLTK